MDKINNTHIRILKDSKKILVGPIVEYLKIIPIHSQNQVIHVTQLAEGNVVVKAGYVSAETIQQDIVYQMS